MKKNGIKIGVKIRQRRLLKGYSQENMAAALNISQKTYSNLENDKSNISVQTLKALAKELDIDVMELLSDDKVIIQHNNSKDNSTFQGGIIVNQSKELVNQLKKQLVDKDEIISLLKQQLDLLKKNK
jgi:transcriptional regulator with XRE-family HTH domain